MNVMTYDAPINEIMLALDAAGELSKRASAGILGDVDADLVRAVIEEAGKFASEELAPLNKVGDAQGTHLVDGKVTTPDGWAEVYQRWSAGGWAALPCPEEYGGQGLPSLVATACNEIWHSANLSFGLGPLLTQGAVDALCAKGTDVMKSVILPKLVSGEWMGTMNLTEGHAGSDLSTLRTKAEPQDDGTYRLFGTKIFISYGDHEMTENIIQLVLARLPDAPEGTRGISLFLVPKFLVNADGSLGERNDVFCTGVEHKLGLHGSPTCTMTYGENGGAIGYLVGDENRGLQVMFIMMNAARLGVATQGVAIAERSYQQALAHAQERTQGHAVDGPRGKAVPIVRHPDVQRMLLRMKAMTMAARTLAFATAGAIDQMEGADHDDTRADGEKLSALLTPVAKAFGTDIGVDVASLGIQVHGGMGYIEETGAAQHLRDARIPPIYEGTNGIQAIDLVTRKLPVDDGKFVQAYIDGLRATADEVLASNAPVFGRMGEALLEAVDALNETTVWMLGEMKTNPTGALAGASPYLRLFGLTAGATYLARGALLAHARDGEAGGAPVSMARFFAENVLGESVSLSRVVMSGSDALQTAAIEHFHG